jgi:hypothetical protein
VAGGSGLAEARFARISLTIAARSQATGMGPSRSPVSTRAWAGQREQVDRWAHPLQPATSPARSDRRRASHGDWSQISRKERSRRLPAEPGRMLQPRTSPAGVIVQNRTPAAHSGAPLALNAAPTAPAHAAVSGSASPVQRHERRLDHHLDAAGAQQGHGAPRGVPRPDSP